MRETVILSGDHVDTEIASTSTMSSPLSHAFIILDGANVLVTFSCER